MSTGVHTAVKRLQTEWVTNFGNLAALASETVTLASHVDCAGFYAGELEVRLHPATDLGAGTSLVFSVLADGYDFADPAVTYLTPITGATLTVSGAISGPQYGLIPLGTFGMGTGAFGKFIAVQMTATQGSPSAALSVDLGLDLVLKRGYAPHARAANTLRGYRGG